jgi:hypothetical protein
MKTRSRRDHQPGLQLWPGRISNGFQYASKRRNPDQSQASRTHLARGRLKTAKKQVKKRRLSGLPTVADYPVCEQNIRNHVWSYDFVEDRTVMAEKFAF